MPSWKKVILSGSNAALNSLTVSNGITGSLFGTASWAQNALTSSYSLNPTVSGAISQVDYIDFNTGSAEPAWKSGRVYWNNTDGALSVYNAEADIALQVGQESWVRVFNEGGLIANGTAVRIVGSHGDVPLIIKAQSVQVSGSALGDNQIIGIATHDIETNSIGYVTTQGLTRGLNTNAFTDGDLLFVSSSAGLLTNVIPQAPFEVIQVGICVKAGPGGSGIVFVFPTQPIDFGDLASADRGIYQYGDIWSYQQTGSVGVWKHGRTLSGSYGITGSLNVSGGITGSLFGTASYALTSSFLTSDTNAFLQNGNSFGTTALLGTNDNQSLALETSGSTRMFISSSGNIGIGTTAPTKLLDVNGDVLINGQIVGRGGGNISSNTTVGQSSLTSNTTGTNNVSIGTSTLFLNTTGANNVAIGSSGLGSNISGNSNTAIGQGSLQNSIGSSNTAIGQASLSSITSGGSNTAFGRFAGRYIADKVTLLTSIDNSVLVGYQASPLGQAQTNQIVIGYDATGLGSNTTVLGNSSTTTTAIYGNVGIGTITPGAPLHVNGSLIAGTSTTSGLYFNTANDTLNISNVRAIERSGASLFFGNANTNLQLRTNSTTRLYIDNTGNIGIGSTVPNAKLDVNGNTIITGSLTVTAGITGSLFGTASYALTSSFLNSTTNAFIQGGNSFGTTALLGTNDNQSLAIETNGSEKIRVTSTGLVGIGTSLPSASLHVKGAYTAATSASFSVENSNASSSMAVFGDNKLKVYSPANGTSTVNLWSDNTTAYLGTSGIGAHISMAIGTNTTSYSQAGFFQNGVEIKGSPWYGYVLNLDKGVYIADDYLRFGTGRIDSSGSLGLGKTVPTAKLDISGSALITGSLTVTQGITGSLFGTSSWAVSASWAPAPTNAFVQNGNSFGTTALLGTNDNNSLALETSGSTRMFISSSGNIGIGTTTPQRKLDVLSGADNFVSVGIDAMAVGQWAGIHFGYAEGANNLYRKSAIVFERTDLTSNNAQGKVHILNGPQGNANSATLADSKLTINEAGNVGIGTTTPSQLLEVNGNALIKTAFIGTISAFGDNYTSFSHISRTGSGDYSLLSDNAGATYLNAKPNQNIRFRIDNTDKAILSSSGDFGINTTTPNAKLDVNGNAIITGSLTVTGRITAEEFHTEFVSSSIIYLSGSTKFGDSSDDVMSVTGSLRVEGSITGSLLGTASYATQALSASWAPAATTAATASFVTSSNVYGPNGSNSILSASFAISSSYVVSSSNALTASYILNAQSSSVANAVRISDSNTTGTTQYIGFVGAQSGTSTLFTDIDLTYVPSTNTLNATSSRAVSSSYAVSASNALTASSVSGIGGTTNYLAKFTGANTLSSSAIYDTGTNVMIGTTSPGGRFTVTPNGTGTGINGTAIYAYSNGGPTIDAGAANSSSIVATNNSINSSTLVAQNIGSGPIFSLKNNTDAVVVHVLNNGRVGLRNITPNADLDVSGSAIITGSLRVVNGITGSLFGTSSWAVSASWAPAATTAATASFVTSSNVYGPNGSNSILSASFAISSSRTVSSSYAISSSNALTASFIVSSSYAISSSNALTASYALTASFLNGGTTNAFIQNGNSFGTTALLGTNDNQSLALETSGSTRMFISSSGNVGIGTTSPTAKLQVDTGTSSGDGEGIRLNRPVAGTHYHSLEFATAGTVDWSIGQNSNDSFEVYENGSAATTRLSIKEGGNVGIGTTNPGAKLDVAGALGGTVGIGGSTIRLINTDTSNAASITAGITGVQNEGMQFSTDGTTRMVISSGKIGINTTAPTHRFTSNVSSMSPSGDQDYPIFASVAGKGVVLGYDTSNDISVINGVHTAVAWKGIALATVGGNVGIGTVTPGYKLDVNGNTNVNGTLTATVKSFIIDHPTKEGKKLQYGVLEGPEHSVYVRGKLTNTNIITLPDHWTGLVHEDTITVNLTPIGKRQDLWVETVTDTSITVGSDNEIDCFYTVFAERKDIEKLVTEFDK